MVLACQVSWSQYCEAALQADQDAVEKFLRIVEATLNVLADSVLHEQPAVRRRKLEHLVIRIFVNTNLFKIYYLFALKQITCSNIGNVPSYVILTFRF